MSTIINIAVTIQNETDDTFELDIAGALVTVTREQLYSAIELTLDSEKAYDIGCETEMMFESLEEG